MVAIVVGDCGGVIIVAASVGDAVGGWVRTLWLVYMTLDDIPPYLSNMP